MKQNNKIVRKQVAATARCLLHRAELQHLRLTSAIVKFDLREMCQKSNNFDLRFCMNINAFLVDLSIIVPRSPLFEVKLFVLSDVFS